jgi:dTDP-4-dehydrorhamnose reductase
MKVLVLGAAGLIGNNVFNVLLPKSDLKVTGLIRLASDKALFHKTSKDNLAIIEDFTDLEKLTLFIINMRPDVVINCAGITKHRKSNYLDVIAINSKLPHHLANISEKYNFKLFHISTDCVFSGTKGNYTEEDLADPIDFYGKSKLLGEILYGNTVTFRISTIGGEVKNNYGLLNWFLEQNIECIGYNNAIFSGLPTKYFAEILYKLLYEDISFNGLYHISSKPISKFSLLKLINSKYSRNVNIIPNDTLVIDRSLCCEKFKNRFKIEIPIWDELINFL